MTDFYTEEQTVTRVTRLTRTRLSAYVEAEAITPARSARGPAFRRSDIARLELLCELEETYGMDAEALALVLSVLDQLHAARRDLDTLHEVIAAEPPEARKRIAAALARARAEAEGD